MKCQEIVSSPVLTESIDGFSIDNFLKKYIPWLQKELGIEDLPEIEIVDHLDGSFGTYDNQDKIMYLVVKNRHPVDVLRTLAHELVHYKQDQNGYLGPTSGHTGSTEENEANAKAGIVMRNFAHQNPEYLSHDINEEQEVVGPASTDYNQASYNRLSQIKYNVPLQNIPPQKLQLINALASTAQEILPNNIPAQVPEFKERAEQVLAKIPDQTLRSTVVKWIKTGLENPTWQGVIMGVLMTCVARATVGGTQAFNLNPADTTIVLEFLLPAIGNIVGMKLMRKASWKDSIKAGVMAGAAGGGAAIALKGLIGEDFTGKAKPGSRPGSLRRKAGLKKGETMSHADLMRLSGRATEMKRSKNKATRQRGIQLARQVNWYKNFHKKKSEAVGYGE